MKELLHQADTCTRTCTGNPHSSWRDPAQSISLCASTAMRFVAPPVVRLTSTPAASTLRTFKICLETHKYRLLLLKVQSLHQIPCTVRTATTGPPVECTLISFSHRTTNDVSQIGLEVISSRGHRCVSPKLGLPERTRCF